MAGFALTPGTNLVTSGPAHKAVLRLALPTVAAMLTQSVVNEIDIVFFARLPCPESSNAQAALLPSLIVLWLFGGSLSAISVGTQAFTARRFARHSSQRPRRPTRIGSCPRRRPARGRFRVGLGDTVYRGGKEVLQALRIRGLNRLARLSRLGGS